MKREKNDKEVFFLETEIGPEQCLMYRDVREHGANRSAEGQRTHQRADRLPGAVAAQCIGSQWYGRAQARSGKIQIAKNRFAIRDVDIDFYDS
ncbi:TPA: hypothetical protein QDC44_005329 [Burkholderia cepacia ATCC 25416]|nr:hypothetical protein [Burkholderia cepacia ATCC 25416]HDV6370155.1 hypothetical protein [Burkholderia cepacia]